MADDKTDRSLQDRVRINLYEDYELARAFCSERIQLMAIAKATPIAAPLTAPLAHIAKKGSLVQRWIWLAANSGRRLPTAPNSAP